ncbi:MAG: peptide ABC transporter substrate-binding protein [Anaerolineales bacterium]|nr:peptide ABC transporter substrate-binding protein [Anaerolineales bacterium]
MRKLFALLSLLVIASMALAACGPTAAPSTDAPAAPEEPAATEPPVVEGDVRAAVLRVNSGTYPDTIDPQKSSFVNEIGHLKMIYVGLTSLNEKLETVPGGAESWEFNEDATQLTFHIREGMTYSDGVPLNAARYEYALHRNINPATAGEYAFITDEIVGAPEWRTSSGCADPAACTEEEGVALEAALGIKSTHADGSDCVINADTGNAYDDADCNTLVVTMSKPAPYFATVLGLWVTYPVRQELVEEGGDLWWTSTKFQVGNGPFMWQEAEPFVRALFVPNPNFTVNEIPTYSVEYRYITDGAVQFEAYKNDELDVIGYGGEDVAAIAADSELAAQNFQYAGSCTILLRFSLQGTFTAPDGSSYETPFKDVKVREAFAFAFDADGWARDVDSGLSLSTWTWIPRGYPGYKEESPLAFDPERAKAALAESTYAGPDALNALGLKLTFGDTARNRARSEWIVANYKNNLGVDIALDPVDATTFTALTKDPATFPLLARQGWCADYPHQQNWLSVYWKSSSDFASDQGYSNPEFDALIDQADGTVDPAAAAALYEQAQDLLLADIPSVFGYNTSHTFLVKPWITGFITTPQDNTFPGDWTPWTISVDTKMAN